MATMNKPTAQDKNWYAAVTKNWGAIEKDLIDKQILSAKGDLLGALGQGNPGRVPVGTNGQILSVDTSQGTGLRWADADDFRRQAAFDVLWGKKFFQDEGFLPSTKVLEYPIQPPAFGSGYFPSTAWVQGPGYIQGPPGIGWFDLGAARSRILVVFGSVQVPDYSSVHLTPSEPNAYDPDGYSFWNIGGTAGPEIRKCESWTYTRLDSSTGIYATIHLRGYALYYDDSSNTLKLFLRVGSQWFLAQSATSSAYSTLRYLALQSQYNSCWWMSPLVCYAD